MADPPLVISSLLASSPSLEFAQKMRAHIEGNQKDSLAQKDSFQSWTRDTKVLRHSLPPKPFCQHMTSFFQTRW